MSAGVVLFQRTANELQIIMVKRRTSYAFGDFVSCHYPSPKISIDQSFVALERMLNHMTSEEKKYISSNSPELIFSIYWLINPIVTTCPPDVLSKYKQFEEWFKLLVRADLGKRLSQLIHSTNSSTIFSLYEFPKGRVNRDEDYIIAAQRELQEETNYGQNSYFMWDNVEPFHLKFTAGDDLREYHTVYYFAELTTSSASTKVNIRDWSQKIEIGEIAKFPISTIIALFPLYRQLCSYLVANLVNMPEIKTVPIKLQ